MELKTKPKRSAGSRRFALLPTTLSDGTTIWLEPYWAKRVRFWYDSSDYTARTRTQAELDFHQGH